MKLTKEFKKVFVQSLLESYNVHCQSMDLLIQDNFVRYELKGHLDQSPFTGSLNIVYKNDGLCKFTVTGWLEDRHVLIDKATKDSPYLKAIDEVTDFLLLHFNRNIKAKTHRIFLGTGYFSYKGRSITDIFINMKPAVLRQLDIENKDNDQSVVTHLLDYDLFFKDNQECFNYKNNKEHKLYSMKDIHDLDVFKKFLIANYMTVYSQMTNTPNLLRIEEFDTLSYQNVLDYLIVQDMHNI